MTCDACGNEIKEGEDSVDIPGIGVMHKPGNPECIGLNSNPSEVVGRLLRLATKVLSQTPPPKKRAPVWEWATKDEPTHRDPERITGMLEEIERIWRKHPDLRLVQLLLNAQPQPNYSTDDDALLDALRRIYP